MSEHISLAPDWTFSVRLYCQMLRNPRFSLGAKEGAEAEIMRLAQAYDRLTVRVSELMDETDALKTRIDEMLEEQCVEEAKARMQSAQFDLLHPEVAA